jgi:phosphopantetheine binding protein
MARLLQAQEATATKHMESVRTLSPEPRLRLLLASTFHELTDLKLLTTNLSKTFRELGFGSLFLIQATRALQLMFNISITSRQLTDKLSTLDSLTAHIDRHLVADVPKHSKSAASRTSTILLLPTRLPSSASPNPNSSETVCYRWTGSRA